MNILSTEGIYHGVPFADYLADPGVNNGALSDLNRSPAHCYALHIDPARPVSEPSDAMRAGSLLHCLVLEPEAFEQRYVIKPVGCDYRKKEGQEWKAKQTAQIITHEDMDRAQAQRDAILRDDYMAGILEIAVTEVTLIWQDKSTGLRCKARPDAATTSDIIADVKTTTDITAKSVQRAIASYSYHRQQAHYLAGMEAISGRRYEFVFFFVSSTYPYLAVPYQLDEESAQQGRDEVSELLAQYEECKRLGRWPLSYGRPEVIGLPQYAKRSNELEISYA